MSCARFWAGRQRVCKFNNVGGEEFLTILGTRSFTTTEIFMSTVRKNLCLRLVKRCLIEIVPKTVPNSASHLTALPEIRWPQSENKGFDAYLFVLWQTSHTRYFFRYKTTKDQTLTLARTHTHATESYKVANYNVLRLGRSSELSQVFVNFFSPEA